MKILHYALGFPPYRTGGLTKYCIDLMQYQLKDGNEVALLWPGAMIIPKWVHIIKHKKWNGIGNFELINPLPVALDEGIKYINSYIQKTDKGSFTSFFENYKPDAIHIHTLMGLYPEFIAAAKELGIKTVFTSHDYYGICPKVTLFRNGTPCNDTYCENCAACNKNALSIGKIAAMQSPLYRFFKDFQLIKIIRKKHRDKYYANNFSVEDIVYKNIARKQDIEDYKNLRHFYVKMLKQIDIIHFNSSVARNTYLKYLTPNLYEVIPITHGDIQDNRAKKTFDHSIMEIIYLGPAKEYKGFFFLIKVLDRLWDNGYRDFRLNLYSRIALTRPYICCRSNGYQYSQLKDIFNETDLLIAPSVWKETFGFTVLEALSYGVPVLVSENVGAKDIVSKINPQCVVPMNEDRFVDVLIELLSDRSKLEEINSAVCSINILPQQLPYKELYTHPRGKT